MSLSLVLPLTVASMGLESFPDEDTSAAIQQNFRMLLLTQPGEYVMDINFGVGLRKYLFQQGTPSLGEAIRADIFKQCGIYMPYVTVDDIEVDFTNIDSNSLTLRIKYTVSNSVYSEVLELTTSI